MKRAARTSERLNQALVRKQTQHSTTLFKKPPRGFPGGQWLGFDTVTAEGLGSNP